MWKLAQAIMVAKCGCDPLFWLATKQRGYHERSAVRSQLKTRLRNLLRGLQGINRASLTLSALTLSVIVTMHLRKSKQRGQSLEMQ